VQVLWTVLTDEFSVQWSIRAWSPIRWRPAYFDLDRKRDRSVKRYLNIEWKRIFCAAQKTADKTALMSSYSACYSAHNNESYEDIWEKKFDCLAIGLCQTLLDSALSETSNFIRCCQMHSNIFEYDSIWFKALRSGAHCWYEEWKSWRKKYR